MLPPPEGVWGMPSEVRQKLPGYDPDVAKNRAEGRKIMQKLGYGPDNRLQIKLSTRNIPAYRDPAVILLSQLREVYIDAELEPVDTTQWYPKVMRKDFTVGLSVTEAGVGFIVTNLARPAERIVAFYNQRGTAEQWIKEGKGAIKWTRLSCRTFAANAVRLQLHALAYNLGNFMRTLAMPKAAEPWSLTSLREKLIKIGAKVVSHGRYITFQMAEVAVPRQMFQEILSLIARLRAPPAPA
jgi:ABC-type transport system substrate-binding protein